MFYVSAKTTENPFKRQAEADTTMSPLGLPPDCSWPTDQARPGRNITKHSGNGESTAFLNDIFMYRRVKCIRGPWPVLLLAMATVNALMASLCYCHTFNLAQSLPPTIVSGDQYATGRLMTLKEAAQHIGIIKCID